jgi:hypothetical protein
MAKGNIHSSQRQSSGIIVLRTIKCHDLKSTPPKTVKKEEHRSIWSYFYAWEVGYSKAYTSTKSAPSKEKLNDGKKASS